MLDTILCVAAFLLLLWVVYLKAELDTLTRQTDKLAGLLKRYLKDKTSDPDIATALEIWNGKSKK